MESRTLFTNYVMIICNFHLSNTKCYIKAIKMNMLLNEVTNNFPNWVSWQFKNNIGLIDSKNFQPNNLHIFLVYDVKLMLNLKDKSSRLLQKVMTTILSHNKRLCNDAFLWIPISYECFCHIFIKLSIKRNEAWQTYISCLLVS